MISSRRSHTGSPAVDEWCIPVKLQAPAAPPTRPTNIATTSTTRLTDETLIRLHRLSALESPPLGSAEFERVKGGIEAMLGMVDSVKEFEFGEEERAEDGKRMMADGRIWPTDESMPIDWDHLVQTQEAFLASRQTNLPGPKASRPTHPSSIPNSSSQSLAALQMATQGLHFVTRRGLGSQPHQENSFYVAKLPLTSKNKNPS
ncbi:hypothetical protein VP01_33g3 [Puccinia sorghi]|uniref:Uncharacterized protein n=1 Tax=Puccinia sorghi TaxID=27349 RepID=A0A0L6UYI0_9BASI|nr:hypothetical protein VP01_33g3 [Puccinia sorghi]